ncbi:hypothetical protein AAMO2058_000352400 [Amorphochlora amoebiformis]
MFLELVTLTSEKINSNPILEVKGGLEVRRDQKQDERKELAGSLPNDLLRENRGKTDERAPRYLAVERSPLLDFSHAYQKGRPLWIPEIMAVVDKKMLFGSEWGGSIPRLNRQNPIDFSLIPKHGPDAWLYMMRELAVNVKVIRARLVKVPNGYHQEAIEKWKDEKANEIQNIRGLLAQLLEAAKIQWEDVKLRLEGKERKYIGALTIIREKNKESLTRGDEKTIKMIFPSSDPIKPGKSDPKLAPGWDTWGTTAHQRNAQELEKREKEKVTEEKTDIPQDVPAKTDFIRWSHPSKEWIRVAHGPLRDPLFPHVRPTRLGNSPSRYKKKHARTKSSPPRPKTALGSSVRRSRNVKNSNINSGMLSTSGSIRAETRPTTAPSLLRVRSRSSGDI